MNRKVDFFIDCHDDEKVEAEAFVEGFMASSPNWQRADNDSDASVCVRITHDRTMENKYPLELLVFFDGFPRGRTIDSDWCIYDGLGLVLNVREDLNYAKYVQYWQEDFVSSKAFFASIDKRKTTRRELATRLGVMLADIVNAEDESEDEA